MADWNEGTGDYAGGGESGQAQDRTFTATTSDGRTRQFADFNQAMAWAADNRPEGGTAEVSTK